MSSKRPTIVSHPILSFDDSLAHEAKILGGDEEKEWTAIRRAGVGVASAIIADFEEIGGFPSLGSVLLLAGKGNNAADALIAARGIAERFPGATIDVLFVFGERSNRVFAKKAFAELAIHLAGRASVVRFAELKPRYDLMIDGVFGVKFRSPIDPEVVKVFSTVNALKIRLRASVDVPSGLGEHGAIRADFTYATGIAKEPLFGCENAGRLRYIPIGLVADSTPGKNRVLLPESLSKLAGLRSAHVEKRAQGHVFIVGGSHEFPGAVLMACLAAVRSGVGLVTAFVPENLIPSYAARLPEVMWVGWPVTPDGGLALEGQHLLNRRIDKASALLIGPGMGREVETQALITGIVEHAKVPLVIDADALMPDIVRSGSVARILTPHAGEFERIRAGLTIDGLCRAAHGTVVLKGPVTKICDGKFHYHSLAGGPVLARGGSGDMLAGLCAGLLAQEPSDTVGSACRGVLLHGLAADLLAQTCGQTVVQTTQLLDYLPDVVRSREVLGES